MIRKARELLLSTGLDRAGDRQRIAVLRRLVGRDEEWIAALPPALAQAEWTTAVLTRALVRIGEVEPVCADDVRDLVVGDREALLLELRRSLFGDSIECVLACPSRSCSESLSLGLVVDELLQKPPDDTAAAVHDICIGAAGVVRFRLPTGADQEVAARASDVARGVRELMDRCVLSADHGSLTSRDVRDLGRAMRERDPQAELRLALDCHACGHEFQTTFDTGAFLAAEIRAHAVRLLDEIHVLASTYHWSEGEILSLDPDRRRRYVARIARATAREGVWS
ncbi:MAG: hypothetical protein AAF628_19430 [Planctomycetota bacterium]